MNISWKDLSFLPSDEALAALRSAWAWLLPERFEPVMASALGDVFFQQGSKAVFWLNTGAAEIVQVADSRAHFTELLRGDAYIDWFLPDLIQDLKDAGKILSADYCYTYAILPVFKEGKYEVWNLNPVPAIEHFRVTGTLHKEIRDLPDGATVKIDYR